MRIYFHYLINQITKLGILPLPNNRIIKPSFLIIAVLLRAVEFCFRERVELLN